jgi:uncharacterized membrane protein
MHGSPDHISGKRFYRREKMTLYLWRGGGREILRLAWPAPRHLIVPLLISMAALAMVHLSPPSLMAVLSPLALILVFPVPGYLAVLWAYPGKGDLSPKGRAVLSLGASVLSAAVVGLVLWATPRGLQSGSLATLLSLLSLPLMVMAYLRWSVIAEA